MSVVAFGGPEVAEVIGDRLFRPRVVEGLAYETLVHPSDDRVEALWVARGWVVHHRAPIELRISMCNSACVHEFHSLEGKIL